MSILKFTNGKNRGFAALKECIKYVLNPEKSYPWLKGGHGVRLETAAEDMRTVQVLKGQEAGRGYIHYVLSLNEEISHDDIINIADSCINYYREYQTVWEVHTNTDHLHVHFVMNTVNYKTGKKFSQSKADLQRVKDYINSILEEYGLEPIGKKSIQLYEKYVNLEDDMDYMDIIEDEDFADWDEDTSLYDESDSFFGYEIEEQEQIEEAEAFEDNLNQIRSFFEKGEDFLPEGISFSEAEILYRQWIESLSNENKDGDGFIMYKGVYYD